MTPAKFVVLLVLSTMAVVAAVMVLVDEPSEGEQEAPRIEFVRNETRDHARVNVTTQNVTWDQIQIQMSVDGRFMLGHDENSTIGQQAVFVSPENASRVEVGDRVRFCLDEGGKALSVTFRDTNSSQIFASVEFNEVASCEQPDEEDETESENESVPEETQDEGSGNESREGDGTETDLPAAPREEETVT